MNSLTGLARLSDLIRYRWHLGVKHSLESERILKCIKGQICLKGSLQYELLRWKNVIRKKLTVYFNVMLMGHVFGLQKIA
jgi:hypothetical protein